MQVKCLAGKIVTKMTCNVSSGKLNPTAYYTILLCVCFCHVFLAELFTGQNAVCVYVCLDVNQGVTNHNCCTQRLVILLA